MHQVRNFMVGITSLAVLLIGTSAAAEKLVKKDGDKFLPGLAKSWTAGDKGVSIVISDGTDPQLICDQLKAKLSGATVSLGPAKEVIVGGLALNDLLAKLAEIEIELDPLAALGGLGGGLAMAGPEAGGSIRAHQDMPLPPGIMPDTVFKPHTPEERFVATVVKVERRQFPNVLLTLKLLKKPVKGELKLDLKKNYKAMTLVAGAGENPDYANTQTQKNVGAFFLMDGDRIEGHVVKSAEGQTLYLDYVNRVTK